MTDKTTTPKTCPERIWMRSATALLPVSEWTIYSATGEKRESSDVEYIHVASYDTLAASHHKLLLAGKFALTTPGMIRGRDELRAVIDEAEKLEKGTNG